MGIYQTFSLKYLVGNEKGSTFALAFQEHPDGATKKFFEMMTQTRSSNGLVERQV